MYVFDRSACAFGKPACVYDKPACVFDKPACVYDKYAYVFYKLSYAFKNNREHHLRHNKSGTQAFIQSDEIIIYIYYGRADADACQCV